MVLSDACHRRALFRVYRFRTDAAFLRPADAFFRFDAAVFCFGAAALRFCAIALRFGAAFFDLDAVFFPVPSFSSICLALIVVPSNFIAALRCAALSGALPDRSSLRAFKMAGVRSFKDRLRAEAHIPWMLILAMFNSR
jgi:hypothetical protein